MKIEVAGWKRDHGKKTLVWKTIEGVEITKDRSRRYNSKDLDIVRDELNGLLTLSVFARRVQLNGNYLVQLELTKRDIIALAALALRDERFGDIVDALARKRDSAVAAAA